MSKPLGGVSKRIHVADICARAQKEDVEKLEIKYPDQVQKVRKAQWSAERPIERPRFSYFPVAAHAEFYGTGKRRREEENVDSARTADAEHFAFALGRELILAESEKQRTLLMPEVQRWESRDAGAEETADFETILHSFGGGVSNELSDLFHKSSLVYSYRQNIPYLLSLPPEAETLSKPKVDSSPHSLLHLRSLLCQVKARELLSRAREKEIRDAVESERPQISEFEKSRIATMSRNKLMLKRVVPSNLTAATSLSRNIQSALDVQGVAAVSEHLHALIPRIASAALPRSTVEVVGKGTESVHRVGGVSELSRDDVRAARRLSMQLRQ